MIASARLKVDGLFESPKGTKLVRAGTAQFFLLQTDKVFVPLDFATLRLMAAHGLVEIVEEQDFKVGDWVCRKDGGIVDDLNIYRGKVKENQTGNLILVAFPYARNNYLCVTDLQLAPPLPPADVLKEYDVDFRPWKKGDTWWNPEQKLIVTDSEPIYWEGNYPKGCPFYILVKKAVSPCIGCTYLIGKNPNCCRLGNDTRAASCYQREPVQPDVEWYTITGNPHYSAIGLRRAT